MAHVPTPWVGLAATVGIATARAAISCQERGAVCSRSKGP